MPWRIEENRAYLDHKRSYINRVLAGFAAHESWRINSESTLYSLSGLDSLFLKLTSEEWYGWSSIWFKNIHVWKLFKQLQPGGSFLLFFDLFLSLHAECKVVIILLTEWKSSTYTGFKSDDKISLYSHYISFIVQSSENKNTFNFSTMQRDTASVTRHPHFW